MSKIKRVLSIRVRCVNRASRTFFDRDYWVDLSALSQIDRSRIRLLADGHVPKTVFPSVRSLFEIGDCPVDRSLSFQSMGLTDYFEDDAGNPLSELDLVRVLSGTDCPIVAGMSQSILDLGPAPFVFPEKWTVEAANTIAHFLQLVEIIASGDWMVSDLSLSASSTRINAFQCPDLGQLYSVFLPIRQLFSADQSFNCAYKAYERHLGDARKQLWLKQAHRVFNQVLNSQSSGPFSIGNYSARQLVDIVFYGAGVIHFRRSEKEKKEQFGELITKYGREAVMFRFVSACREIFGAAAAIYHVLRQDFDHWVASGVAAGPDLQFLRRLFEPKPKRPDLGVRGDNHLLSGNERVISSTFVATHLNDGRVALTTTFPEDDALESKIHEFIGSDQVVLPDQPIPLDDYNKWIEELRSKNVERFSSHGVADIGFKILRLGRSVVDVRLSIHFAWWGSGSDRKLVISVVNGGEIEVPNLRVDWCVLSHSEVTDESSGSLDNNLHFQLAQTDSGFTGTLLPGAMAMFYAGPRLVAYIRYQIVVNPNSKLSVFSNDQEVVVADPNQVAEFVLT